MSEPSPARKSISQKIWHYIEQPLTLTAGAIVLALIGKQATFFFAWILLAIAFVRTGFFEGQSLTKRVLGNALASAMLAVILFVVWKVWFVEPDKPVVTEYIQGLLVTTNEVLTKVVPWRWVLPTGLVGFFLGWLLHQRGKTVVNHEECEKTARALESTISRLQNSEVTLEIRNSVLETDLNRARAQAQISLVEIGEKERQKYDELNNTYLEALNQKIDAINVLAETESHVAFLTEKVESLGSELTRHKTSPIEIVYQPNEHYQRIYPAGGRRRVEYYIGIRVSMPVEELIVEFDAYREAYPDLHRQAYQLHERGDDYPYFRFTTLAPEVGEKLFALLTIEEDIRVTTSSTFDVKMETNVKADNIPTAGRIIARGKNVLSRERSFYVRTPTNSHYRVEFTS